MASKEINILIKAKNLASAAIKQVNGELAGIGKHAQRGTGNATRNIERGIVAAGVAAVGGLAYAVKTAASFEEAFTGVEKTVNATTGELKELEETIRGMARLGLGTFEDLASIGEAAGALGVATGDIEEFIDVVARLAMSTDLSTEQASTALGQLGNVLQLSGAEYESFSDILVALGNDGASTEGQIIDLAARFGAAGNAAGLTNEQILTLASTTASMGIEAEAGGGALSRVFNNLTLDMATASEEGELLASTLGMSLSELKTAWSQDAGAVFEDLLAHINELDQFAAASLLSDLGITNVRDINAIRLLSQGVAEYRDQLETANTATGALDTESDKFLDTTARQWFTLQQNVRDVANTIGTALLPIVNELIGEFTAWMSLDSTQAKVGQLAKDVAAGVRDAVTWAKSLDWDDIANAMKTAGQFGQTLLNAFLAMPPWVQTAIVTGWGLNKLTGGALGSIVGELGKGLIKGVLGMNAGVVNARAGIVNVNGPVAGGPGGGGKGGGKFPLLGVAGAAGIALALSSSENPDAQRTNDQARLARGEMTQAQFDQLWNHGAVAQNIETLAGRSVGGSFDREGVSESDTTLKRFGDALPKLATNDVIEHLTRTTEMGLKGVGTTMQVGLQTGLDPIGDVATRILARAEDPKAPPVMAEIKGHLLGLEEIQASYLANGDVHLAAKVQTNIETLHGLIGTQDTQNAMLAYESQRAASSDAAMLGAAERTKAEVAAKGNAQLAKQAEAIAAVNSTKGPLNTIAAKNFSPNINVNVQANSFVSINEWQRVQRSANTSYSTNTGGI